MSRNLLLLSSSRSADTGFLEACEEEIRDTLKGVKRVLFIPYAIIGEENRGRIGMVEERCRALGVQMDNIEDVENHAEAVEKAEAVLVSGGNTFCLLDAMYRNNVIEPLRKRVAGGMPYIGWSAGSNVAGKSIRTTNDMPIVYPPSFDALGLVGFQLNPHFTDAMPPGHRGETRRDRLAEFLSVNPHEKVVAIREGSGLRVTGDTMRLAGEHDGLLFTSDAEPVMLAAGRDLSHLL
ncbi:MAG: dipeptidase PepE [Gammaproteobacteria bacterium]|nr:dipeptidase PepE [Gammaproteobacteria bacterium]